MPPSVARLLVDSSGAKNNPCGFRNWLSWSFTTPACTRTQRSSILSSKMLVMWRERSTIMLLFIDCPLVPVPPPRGVKVR